MRMPLSRRQVLAGAATVAIGATLASRATPAKAAPSNANGLAYVEEWFVSPSEWGTHVWYQPAGGGARLKVLTLEQNRPSAGLSWSPDGSRLAVPTPGGIRAYKPDGSDPITVTSSDRDYGPVAYTHDGTRIVYSHFGEDGYDRLFWVSANGATNYGELFPEMTGSMRSPSIMSDADVLIFSHQPASGSDDFLYYSRLDNGVWSKPQLFLDNGWYAEFSPDNTRVVYQSYVSGFESEVWVADAEVGAPNAYRLAGLDSSLATWAGDGLNILYVVESDEGVSTIMTIPAGGGTPQRVVEGTYPAARPGAPRDSVVRAWGNIALDTAIAVSQTQWATIDNALDTRAAAQCVVLSRGDEFYDALAGSALAAAKGGPLLMTPRESLYSQSMSEIKRVLPRGGLVYLLGGTFALPQPIENVIKASGYQIKRLWGETMFETAAAIAKEITTAPDAVFVATGLTYHDALAAGAAAGGGKLGKAVVVLTDDGRMPPGTAAYLNSITPRTGSQAGARIILAGGPGSAAVKGAYARGQLPTWPAGVVFDDLVGATAIETALMVANLSFSSPAAVGIATANGWWDAMSGGAMTGAKKSPLLLTPPTGLPAAVASYLSGNAATIKAGYLFGGTAALPQHLAAPIGNALGNPQGYVYTERVPNYQHQ